MDALDLIARCRQHGAVIELDGDGFVLSASRPLPDELRAALRASRDQVLLCLRAARRGQCTNTVTPHAEHHYEWECDPNSCGCFREFGYPRWCSGMPCRWIWPRKAGGG
jgi:hypothetical protein